ncbi:prepilin-type N-terminal cleavage/methylation domain-containing protein [uncultured Demequina sp.]|uniref:prepilin-type N-terminal cleavage/methylation domain-containing protein n=1 Tax=uncultured Demequina sp. TaxID=693499 RepID=UPI0025DBDFC8|nr:prepilin-type N-terminal cleavage/methylation domain-containing protein [uncultured Demequina sp.]
MIARIHKSMEEKEKGFTLIELLVVIIIIGILSAIAIPVFLNQREKAVDTGIKSDLRTIANEAESYYVDNQAYPADASGNGSITVGGIAITGSDSATAYDFTNRTNAFTITGVNTTNGSGTTFTYLSDGGGLQ